MTSKDNILIYETYQEASRRNILKGIGGTLMSLILPTPKMAKLPTSSIKIDISGPISQWAEMASGCKGPRAEFVYGKHNYKLMKQFSGFSPGDVASNILNQIKSQTINPEILNDIIYTFGGAYELTQKGVELVIKNTTNTLLGQYKDDEYAQSVIRDKLLPAMEEYIDGVDPGTGNGIQDLLLNTDNPIDFVPAGDLYYDNQVVLTSQELLKKGIMKSQKDVFGNIQKNVNDSITSTVDSIQKYLNSPKYKKAKEMHDNKIHAKSIEYSPADYGSSATQTRTLGGESLRR